MTKARTGWGRWVWVVGCLLVGCLASACDEDGGNANQLSGDTGDASSSGTDTSGGSSGPDTSGSSGADTDTSGGQSDAEDMTAADGVDLSDSSGSGPVTLDTFDPNCNVLATSNMCAFPFPSAYFERADTSSATGVRLNVPPEIFELRANQIPIDTAPLNRGDGASPVSPILLHFGVDVDLTKLPDQHHLNDALLQHSDVAIINMDTGERVRLFVEMDQNRDSGRNNRYAFIIRPMEPMQTGARHAVVVTKNVRDVDGNVLPSSPAFDALRDNVITVHPEIESRRPAFESLFTFLADEGYARDELLIAWDFMVASDDFVLGSILSMREQALEQVGERGLGYTITKVEDDPDAYLSRLVEGTFEVPTFIDPNDTIQYDAEGDAILQIQRQSFPFTMVIPKKAVTEDRALGAV